MMERGRFAPSPTGELHLGNARTALLAWLWARAAGGTFLLRLEDLDRQRLRAGGAGAPPGGVAAAQLAELGWLGLRWDGGVARQSERGAVYAAALQRLERGGLVYPCFCS